MMWGVSLTELLVTLGLLAVVTLGTFGFYVNGIQAGKHAEGLAAATGLAQARLEDLRNGPFLGDIRGVQPRPSGIPRYSEKVEAGEVASGLRQITVTISWSWRGVKRETTLTTIVPEPEVP